MGAEASRPRDAPARPLCAGTTYPPPSAAAFPVCHEDVIPSLARCRPISQDPDGRTDFLSGVSPVSRGRVPRSALRSQLKAREGFGPRAAVLFGSNGARGPPLARPNSPVSCGVVFCVSQLHHLRRAVEPETLSCFFLYAFSTRIWKNLTPPATDRWFHDRLFRVRWTFPLDISGEILISAACGSATEALAF